MKYEKGNPIPQGYNMKLVKFFKLHFFLNKVCKKQFTEISPKNKKDY